MAVSADGTGDDPKPTTELTVDELLKLRPKARAPKVGIEARQWYRIEAQAEGDGAPISADIYLYEDIGASWFGDGITAKSFIDDLRALPSSIATIRLHVNSAGGDVFDAIAMANALRQHPANKEVLIEGIAASAATIVTSAGDTVKIGDNALMMVHDPISLSFGAADDMRAMADVLDLIKSSIIATYRWRSPKNEAELSALMTAETWMGADEAIANGFATEKVIGLKAAASLNAANLASLTVPEAFRARVEELTAKAPEPATPKAIAQACTTAGCPELVEGLLGLPMDQVTARLETAKAAKAAAKTRETAIRALCARTKCPELADAYVASTLSEAQVGQHLTIITAKIDNVEIDGTLTPQQALPVVPTKQDIQAGWKRAIARVGRRTH